MRKELIEALETRFAGVGEKILGRVADRLAKTANEGDDVAALAGGVTIQQLLDSYGDSRATEAAQTAVANYERRYGLKDGRRADVDPDGKGAEARKDADAPGGVDVRRLIADAVAEAVGPLRERVASFEAERTAAGRRARMRDVLSPLPEGLRKGYERMPLDGMSDEDFEAALAEVGKEVEGIGRELESKGAVFSAPKSGPSSAKEASGEEAAAVVSQMQF